MSEKQSLGGPARGRGVVDDLLLAGDLKRQVDPGPGGHPVGPGAGGIDDDPGGDVSRRGGDPGDRIPGQEKTCRRGERRQVSAQIGEAARVRMGGGARVRVPRAGLVGEAVHVADLDAGLDLEQLPARDLAHVDPEPPPHLEVAVETPETYSGIRNDQPQLTNPQSPPISSSKLEKMSTLRRTMRTSTSFE